MMTWARVLRRVVGLGEIIDELLPGLRGSPAQGGSRNTTSRS